MNRNPFQEYIKETEPAKQNKRYAWYTAIGLQAVDGLKTSEYLLRTAVRNIEGEISFEEADALLQAYYKENSAHEAGKPDIELRKPDIETGEPDIEAAKPDIEMRKPDIETGKPDIETTKPDIEMRKPDIETTKPDIETEKPDIKKRYGSRTSDHIFRLYEVFRRQTVLGRSDVMAATALKPSAASEFLRKWRRTEPLNRFPDTERDRTPDAAPPRG